MATIRQRGGCKNPNAPTRRQFGDNERSPDKAVQDEEPPASQAADPDNIVEFFRKHFGPSNGVDLELPPREPMRDPPTFD